MLTHNLHKALLILSVFLFTTLVWFGKKLSIKKYDVVLVSLLTLTRFHSLFQILLINEYILMISKYRLYLRPSFYENFIITFSTMPVREYILKVKGMPLNLALLKNDPSSHPHPPQVYSLKFCLGLKNTSPCL